MLSEHLGSQALFSDIDRRTGPSLGATKNKVQIMQRCDYPLLQYI